MEHLVSIHDCSLPQELPGVRRFLARHGLELTRDLLTVVRRQGLPKISLHGLRHSFASVANSQGVPMFDISRTLGHSSMTVTSNIYTHLFDDTEAQALAAVARAIEKA